MLFFIIELIPKIFIVVDPPAEIVEHVVNIMCDEQPERLNQHRSQPSHLVDAAASWSDHRRLSGDYLPAQHRERSPDRQTNACGDSGQAFRKRLVSLLHTGGLCRCGSVCAYFQRTFSVCIANENVGLKL